MTLFELQRRMAADIMQPLGRGDRVPIRTKAVYIQPNDRLTSRERLEIYSRSYWYRLIDSLHEDFPGLRSVLGPCRFDGVIRAYLTDCPSRSFSMRDLGSRFEAWLRRNSQYAGERFASALDMVRLEWAHIVAWDGGSEEALVARDLALIGADFRLKLQPYVRLLDLQYPVDEVRLRLNAAGTSTAALRAPALSKPKARFLAVHRLNQSVFYKELSAVEFHILRGIRDRQTVTGAIERAISESSSGAESMGQLSGWFAKWAELGWFSRAQERLNDSTHTRSILTRRD